MRRLRRGGVLCVVWLLVLAVSHVHAATADEAGKGLNELFIAHREAYLRLNPLNAMFEGDYRYNDRLGDYISPDYLRAMQTLEQEYLEKLGKIDYSALSEDDRLSHDIFKYDREMDQENFRDGYARMDSLMPISQFFSLPTFLAQLGGGTSAQPFATVEDYDNWLKRIGEFPRWVDQAIANMQEGIKEGIVLPKVIVEKTLPQLDAHVVDGPARSVFRKPVEQFPDSFSAADRARLTADYERSIGEVIVPAYRNLRDFIAGEYSSQARDTVGIGQLSGGQEWYAYLARMHTTTDLTPREIHEIGKQQAAQIFAEMNAIKEEVGFDGDMQAFLRFLREDPRFYYKSADALLESYRALKADVDSRVARLFDLKPKADYTIVPIESFREVSSAAAEYMRPAPDGSRPGMFYVNTYHLEARPIWEREALFIHEAVPGHHFQISIAQEQEHLPKFRRFDGPTAYVEGWGLYAETLGEELGLYQDLYQRMGALNMRIWRANRLVVDTGMHALGWTRERAIDWMKSNSPTPDTDIVAEVERYIAIPGQALAYMIGQLKYLELRQTAEQALGDHFDIRAFHREVLEDGAMPMFLLERKINAWIDSNRSKG